MTTNEKLAMRDLNDLNADFYIKLSYGALVNFTIFHFGAWQTQSTFNLI